ncbi:MAG: hypothetical protein E6J82_09980 [Deltaproteobacteria bacterium]|nr:MAG: hypothetical protein E6J82_09980 [Deltaproteobacteria bacterium]TMB32362.1 MAG: hypothetical protein E6J58_23120 [Deltaproteobacteria bacterium]
MRAALGLVGYTEADLRRVQERAGGELSRPEDLRRVIDSYQYLDDWRANYCIQSVRSSLHNSRITCIDAAILSYGLLELLFPDTKRRLLAIHRRDPKKDEECGHCVALYWTGEGRVGSLSKSSFKGLGHREPEFPDETAIAASYAKAYLEMAFEPLYYGVTTLEEAAPDLDWRFHEGNLNEISSRLQACYAYGFVVDY